MPLKKPVRFVDYATQFTRWQDTETYLRLQRGLGIGMVSEAWLAACALHPRDLFSLELERRACLEA